MKTIGSVFLQIFGATAEQMALAHYPQISGCKGGRFFPRALGIVPLVLLFLGLCASAPLSAQTASFYLAWGQANSRGYVFVGRPERMRDQCNAFMMVNNYRQIRTLIVGTSKVSFSGTTAEACKHIIDNAMDLGPDDKRVFVRGRILLTNYSFVGATSEVVSDCIRFISGSANQSITELTVFDFTFPYSHPIRGLQICGEIASRARLLPGPNVQHYVSGSIRNNGFAFSGTRQNIINSCKQFLARSGITRANEMVVYGFKITTDEAYGDGICDVIFGHASVIENPGQRYEISGSVRNRDFWFVGSLTGILNSCVQFTNDPINRLRSVRELVLGVTSYKLKAATFGSGICGIVAYRARRIADRSSLILVSGSIDQRGFSFTGTAEDVQRDCAAFLQANRIGERRGFYIRVFSSRERIRLTKSLRGVALCEQIFREGMELPATLQNAQWDLTGQVGNTSFYFKGILQDVIGQCRDFFRVQKIGAVSTLMVEGKPMVIRPTAYGSEACQKIVFSVSPVQVDQLFMVSGRIGLEGFSFVADRFVGPFQCADFFRRRGVNQADGAIVFDFGVNFVPPALTADGICQRLIDNHSVIFEDQEPEIDAEGSVAGVPFKFSGPIGKVNDECSAMIEEKQINRVDKMMLMGDEIASPNEFWSTYEICGVIIKHRLDATILNQ